MNVNSSELIKQIATIFPVLIKFALISELTRSSNLIQFAMLKRYGNSFKF